MTVIKPIKIKSMNVGSIRVGAKVKKLDIYPEKSLLDKIKKVV